MEKNEQQELNVNTRKLYLDIIRIFACFMVIINHTLSARGMYGDIVFFKWLISDIGFALCKTGVTLFLMVSGALLLKRTKDESYKKIFKRCVHFILLAYVWAVIYGEYWSLYFTHTLSVNVLKTSFFSFLSQEGSWHLWYLYLIIGIYFMLPFLRRIVKDMDKRDWAVYLSMYAFLGLIIPFYNAINSSYPISFHRNFSVPLLCGFIGIYICACYIDELPLKKSYLIVAISAFVVGLFINVFISARFTIKAGEFSYVFDDASCLPVVLTAFGIFYIVKFVFNNISVSVVFTKMIKEMSLCTFGIYLIHPIFLNSLALLDWYNEKWADIIAKSLFLTFLLQIVTFIVCGMICTLIRRIPIIKKIVS